MKALKIIALIVGFIMIMFGLVSYISSLATATTDADGMMLSPMPINEVNGIAVDSKGQIYIGNGISSCIQVFSTTGQFMYGFAFPTGGSGYFSFAVDDQDVVHIVTARTESYFQYYNGKLIYSEPIDISFLHQYEEYYNMQSENCYSYQDKEYFLSSRDQITIHDLSTDTQQRITLDTPSWPLSSSIGWLIIGVGILIELWSFSGLLKSSSKSYNRK